MFDFNAALAGGSSLMPDTIGETVSGIIQNAKLQQANDIKTGKPDTWDNGEPKMQILIDVETSQGDPGTFFIKTWGLQKKAFLQAITNSPFKDANSAMANGNRFSVTYLGEGESTKPGFNRPKLYEYKFEPGTATGFEQFDNELPAPATTPATPQPPAQAQPQTQPTGGVDITALIRAGMDDTTIASSTGVDINAIALIRANL